MERRSFLRLAIGFAAAEAAKELIPFNRVWSFPEKIVIANPWLSYPGLLSCPTPLQYTMYGGGRGGGKRFIAEQAAKQRNILFYSNFQYLRWEPNTVSPNFGKWVPSEAQQSA